jgi:Uma2 family endonuclease
MYTVQQFDAFANEDTSRAYEFVGGEIYEVPACFRSSRMAAQFLGYLFVYLRDHDIGHLTGADGGYQVCGERYMPAVGFISYAHQPPSTYTDSYNPNPPDLAVEVVAPDSDPEPMRIKVTNYLAAGTVVWLVNMSKQTVEVYVPGKPVRILTAADTLNGAPVLPGFRLRLAQVFG